MPGKDPNKFTHPKNSVYGFLDALLRVPVPRPLLSQRCWFKKGKRPRWTGTSVIPGLNDGVCGSTQYQYTRENAGLTLKVKVSKIDDNGFVSLNIDRRFLCLFLRVKIMALISQYFQGNRCLGLIRLRDRQTLVLTGVIQDQRSGAVAHQQ